jgi:hypothetical protein
MPRARDLPAEEGEAINRLMNRMGDPTIVR